MICYNILIFVGFVPKENILELEGIEEVSGSLDNKDENSLEKESSSQTTIDTKKIQAVVKAIEQRQLLLKDEKDFSFADVMRYVQSETKLPGIVDVNDAPAEFIQPTESSVKERPKKPWELRAGGPAIQSSQPTNLAPTTEPDVGTSFTTAEISNAQQIGNGGGATTSSYASEEERKLAMEEAEKLRDIEDQLEEAKASDCVGVCSAEGEPTDNRL